MVYWSGMCYVLLRPRLWGVIKSRLSLSLSLSLDFYRRLSAVTCVVGFKVGVRARDFPVERSPPETPLEISK